MDNDDSIGWVI